MQMRGLFITGVILFFTSSIHAQSPQFLTLPFTNGTINMQQGWLYSYPGHPLHPPSGAFDFINGKVDTEPWKTFEVVAAADGVAMQSFEPRAAATAGVDQPQAYGYFVLIQHNQTDGFGNHYFTLYAHLDPASIDPKIPFRSNRHSIDYSTWLPVKRGDYLALADTSGTDVLHLHFEVRLGGYRGKSIDPYDISGDGARYTRDAYPPNGPDFKGCGPAYLWAQCPPLPPAGVAITRALLDGIPWSGPLSSAVTGPDREAFNFSVPTTASNFLGTGGLYFFSYSPPSAFQTPFVTPSMIQTLPPGGNLVFVVNGSSPSNFCAATKTQASLGGLGIRAATDCSPPPPPLTASCSCSPNSVVAGQAIACTSVVSGGVAPFTYAWSTDGLKLGTFQSVSTAYGNSDSHTVNLLVADSAPTPSVSSCSIPINLSSTLAASCSISPNPIAIGQSATVTASAAGGAPPYRYSINNGPWLTSNLLTVTPSATGVYSANVRIIDSQSQQASGVCGSQVSSAPTFALLTLSNTKTVQAGQQIQYDFAITPQNGFTGISNWQISGLPSGISVTNSSQQVSVTGSGASFSVFLQTSSTTPAGSYPLIVTAASGTITQTLPLTLKVAPMPLSGSCLVNGQTTPLSFQAGNQATFAVNAIGGTSPLHYAWTGVAGNDNYSTFQIFSSAGTFNISAVVSDSASPAQQITVACPTLTVIAPTLSLSAGFTSNQLHPGDTGGLVQVTATYANIPANAPITMTISGLPSGVTATSPSQLVSGSGVITLSSNFSVSTIAQPGNYNLTATVSVAFISQSVAATLQVVAPPTLSVNNCSFNPPTIWAGQSSTASVPNPSGGTPPYQYSWSGAVTSSAQSVVAFFPSAGSTYTANLTVFDSGSGPNRQTRSSSCSVVTYGTNTPPQNPGSTYSPLGPHPGNTITINLFSSGGFSSNTQVLIFGGLCGSNGCFPAIVGGSINSTGTSMQALAILNNADNYQVKVRNTSSGALVLAGIIPVQ